MERSMTPTFSVPATERRQRYERAWEIGELLETLDVYADVMSNRAANDELAEFFRDKIRSIVDDPQTASTLCPTDYPIGAKRMCLDTDYYATYNLPHVRLVDIRTNPIRHITNRGIDTVDESFEFDAIVFATGFDALTGAITAVDIVGRDDLALKDKWSTGPSTYLGTDGGGFPQSVPASPVPGSPSVLSNMVVSIEQHVDWMADCVTHLRCRGLDVIEPTEVAEAGWMRHVDDCAAITLFPEANSWYMGANVPGKPRVFLPYPAGVDFYRAACDEVVARNYLGFRLSGPRRATLSRRDRAPVAARRGDGAQRVGRVESAGDRVDDRRRRACIRRSVGGESSARSRCARGDRRHPAGRGGRPGVSPLPSADHRSPSDRRVLPRRRLGSRGRHVGRSAVSGPLRAVRRGHRLGGLPSRTGAPLPRGGR